MSERREMKLLVSGATKTLREMYAKFPQWLGVLVIPKSPGAIDLTLVDPPATAAMDNFAFSGFDKYAYAKTLRSMTVKKVPLLWVSCPDVVGDAVKTERLFLKWSPFVTSFGQIPALVLQDGITENDIRRLRPEAVFVGGSTAFKTHRETIRGLIRAARRSGTRWVHMGRVNTRSRFFHAYQMGVDTIDGSGFSKWSAIKIPKAMRWMDQLVPKRGFFKSYEVASPDPA